MLIHTALGAAVLLVLTACVSTPSIAPEDCRLADYALSATLPANGPLEPQDLVMCVGQQVTLTVTVGRDGVFHVHGLDDVLPAREVHSGETDSFNFEPAREGQFPIELHTNEQPQGVQLGIMTVLPQQ